MIRNIERTWFEVWGTETAQNKVLKGLLTLFIITSVIQAVCIVILALKPPVLIAATGAETRILVPSVAPEEVLLAEIRRSVTTYTKAHHSWDWQGIEGSFKEASRFVHADFQKAFARATAEQLKIAKEKRITQVFHISDLQIDTKAQTARVSGDRILVVDGLRATNHMTLDISYITSGRSIDNPEGLYITAERLVMSPR